MHTLKQFLTLLIGLVVSTTLHAQTPNNDLQTVLQKLDRGESVEHMLINLSDINFATGTANLEPTAKTYLDDVAKLLRSVPNMSLNIKGHADNTGSNAVNEKLSADRANAVRNYLLGLNIVASRLSAQGYGSSQPVSENTNAEGRAKNRRVEMEILKKETVKTLQDVIVLRNGERIGSIVRNYDMNRIQYRQFTDATERQIETSKVEKIIFADGREVMFANSTPEKQTEKKEKSASSFKFRPFA
jgi:outer membrane protein OmpA-like peptidoglycan-associated protein